MITTRQLAAEYMGQANRLTDPASSLWCGAYKDVAEICTRYHRAKARDKLVRLGRKLRDSHMAISLVYVSAARRLGSRAKFGGSPL